MSLVFLFFVGMKMDTTIPPFALHQEMVMGRKGKVRWSDNFKADLHLFCPHLDEELEEGFWILHVGGKTESCYEG